MKIFFITLRVVLVSDAFSRELLALHLICSHRDLTRAPSAPAPASALLTSRGTIAKLLSVRVYMCVRGCVHA
jgi:hypothetical protein